jgi:hypothetical protein
MIWNPVAQRNHKFRLSFITLTIAHPEPLETTVTHPALKVFLQHFKTPPAKKAISEQMKSYIWKCELQERGQIHYHITTNAFLHYWEIRRVWNGIQFRRGWIEDYLKKTGKTDPNSTDVHSVYKVRDIGAYLSKYLSKRQVRDVSEYGFPELVYEPTLAGKVWDCSNDLKIKRFSDEMDTETEERIRSGISCGKAKRLSFPRCEIFHTKEPQQLLSEPAKKAYENWKKA